MRSRLLTVFLSGLLAFGLVACDDTGDGVEQDAQDIEQGADQQLDEADQAIDDAADELDDVEADVDAEIDTDGGAAADPAVEPTE